MKMRVETVKDSLGRIRTLRVFKGRQRRGVDVDFIYDDAGVLKDFMFDGRREDLPNIPELIALINTEFMERIGTIKTVDLVSLITKISEITEIKDITGTVTLVDTIHQNYNITEYAVLHGEENTHVEEAGAAYVLKKTIAISALNRRSVSQIDYRACRDAGSTAYGFKVTRIIDGGAETTIFETTTGFPDCPSSAWFTETFTKLEGSLIVIKVYLKGDGTNQTDSFDFRVLGEFLREKYEYIP